jgi:hypothetical protein
MAMLLSPEYNMMGNFILQKCLMTEHYPQTILELLSAIKQPTCFNDSPIARVVFVM